jgi:hypothetical protein
MRTLPSILLAIITSLLAVPSPALAQLFNPDPANPCACVSIKAFQNPNPKDRAGANSTPLPTENGDYTVRVTVNIPSAAPCAAVTIESIKIEPVGTINL